MGTRSATLTRDSQGNELCRHYRHYDGYPDGHGADLARVLLALEGERDPMRWLTEYMQAMEDIGCERDDPSTVHGDLEWLYLVRIPERGRVRVTVWQIDFDQSYEDAMEGDPEADGTPQAFLAQVMGEPVPPEADEDPYVDEEEANTDDDVLVLVEFVLEGPATASVVMPLRRAKAALDELDRRLDGRVRAQVPLEFANENGDFVRVVPNRVIATCVRMQEEQARG